MKFYLDIVGKVSVCFVYFIGSCGVLFLGGGKGGKRVRDKIFDFVNLGVYVFSWIMNDIDK